MTVGIDLSESVVRSAVVNDKGEVTARAEHTDGKGGITAAVRDVAKRAQSGAGSARAGAGVGMPWPGDEMPQALSAVVTEVLRKTPTTIAAGPAMVLAETWCGAARGLSNVVAFAISEHVNAGLMMNGELWRGANGFAGSVGWLALNPVEREDYRKYGSLEAEVGAAGIVRRLVWRIKSGDRSRVVDQVGGDLARLTAEHVFGAARTGDGVCISVVRDTAKYVGMAIANLATVVDPQAVVLGGTLASSGDIMLDAIRIECSRRLRPVQSDRVKILLSTLGADSIAIGAARAAVLGKA